MSIEVERLEAPFDEEWNGILDRTSDKSPFHAAEALAVMADHSGQRLHPLVGYKGEESVGVFPLFTAEYGPFTAAFSPPPRLKVSYLGPAVVASPGMSANRVEKRRRRFVEAALEWLEEHCDPRYVHVRTSPAHGDTRPFQWAGFSATPRFTYEVDLDPGADDLFEAFSRDVRTNVRDASEVTTIRTGDHADIQAIVEQVRARYDAQGVAFPVTASFVIDLYDALPEGYLRPYVCEVDGEFAGGSIVLDDGDTVYGWLGSVVPEVDVDVNDLLHWHVIREYATDGHSTYDLVGANDARLARFKAKFSPSLARYHELTRAGPAAHLAERLYRRVAL